VGDGWTYSLTSFESIKGSCDWSLIPLNHMGWSYFYWQPIMIVYTCLCGGQVGVNFIVVFNGSSCGC